MVLIAAVAVTYAACMRFKLWGYFAVPALVPEFLDLHAVLSASDCHRLGYDVYAHNPCDATLRPLGYPRAWLVLGDLGLHREDGSWLGFALAMLAAVGAALSINPGGAREAALSAGALLSPAVMLGVERGNNDLAMFLLVLGASALWAGTGRWRAAGAYLAIWLAAMLKLYPVFGLAMFGANLRSRRQLMWLAAVSAIGSGLFLWYLLPDLERLAHTVPSPVRRWTFGARLVFLQLGIEHWAATALGALAMAAAAGRLSRRLDLDLGAVAPRARALFIASSAILLGCFFLNTNYDYRCIFFVGTFPLLFACQAHRRPAVRWAGGLLMGATLAIMWAELAVDRMMAAAGLEQANFLVADRFEAPAVRFAEQVLTWGVLTGLGAIAWQMIGSTPLPKAATRASAPGFQARLRAPPGS